MASTRLDPEALGRVVIPEDPVLAPDGTRLLFTRHRPQHDGSSRPEVVLVEGLDGRPTARVLQRRARLARWSPDGRRIAFVRQVRGAERSCLLDAADGVVEEIYAGLAGVADIVWAPDGRRIALIGATAPDASPRDARPPGAVVLDVIDGTTTWHAAAGEVAGAVWSPDGQRLALRVRDPNGYVAWLEVVEAGRRGATAMVVGGPTSRILGVTWAPDGGSLVILGDPTFTLHPGIQLADAASGRLRPLIAEPRPSISVIGGWLDATRLLVHGRERGGSSLYVLDTATAQLEPVAQLEGRSWGLSVDVAGTRFATVRETATEPPAVIVGDVATGAWTRMPGAGRRSRAFPGVARPETMAVASDGTDLDVWVLPARGRPATGPGPAILMVHGGPHADVGDGWEAGLEQLLAADGFVVAWSNPRGSTSYGRAFSDAVIGDIGRPEVDDLLAVTEAMGSRPDVDPERIGICGYSHGGYLAAVAITRTRRFAAAVCWSPFTDLLAEWGMSDEGRGWGRWLVGGDPIQEPERYRERSPAWHVAPGVAPTLLLHGERDERCPIGQSTLFQSLLDAVGTPTRLVRLPDADHDLFASPALVAEVARETAAWFTTHLRPGEVAA